MDFERINSGLLQRAESLLSDWLPAGKLHGKEFTCGDLQGSEGNSLSINIETGLWKDFATSDGGGDLISLYAAIRGISQGDAAKQLDDNPKSLSAKPKPTRKKAPQIIKPNGACHPDFSHSKFGNAKAVYKYCDADKSVMFYIARYEPRDMKKQYLPFTYTDSGWQKKAWPAPRPIYGLELLDNRPVLIVEGEKAADALRSICSQYAVVTWPGGGQAVDKINWKPIFGKRVLIWPDADEPGIDCANKIAFTLYSHCPEIKIIDVTERTKGWDAADAVASKWSWSQIIDWAKPRVSAYQPPVKPEIMPDPDPPEGEVKLLEHSQVSICTALGLAMCGKNYICNTDNVIRILTGISEFKNIVWYDEFHHKYFTKWESKSVREWDDIDDLKLMVCVQNKIGLHKMSETHINQAIRLRAKQDCRNEPKDYMQSVTWDHVNRIESFFVDCFGTDDNDYSRAASKNWWLGIIARVYSPGCKVDNMIVLESAQGQQKSTALSVIGGQWYSEVSESVSSKDFYMAIQGKLILEIAELDAFSRAEANTIKKMITCRVDRFRPPYGRATQDFPRQCILVGTTNDNHYLKDDTGGRRIWPIKIGGIKLELISNIRDQLFAEAVYRYKSGETWWMMPKSAAVEQESRRQDDPWEEAINDWLVLNQKAEVRASEVATLALKLDIGKVDKRIQSRICTVLRIIGWQSRVIKRDGVPIRRWINPLTFKFD